ncbi:putative DNA-binding protein (MmcQ/YjbR family) [Mycetocola sp. BIGb0189]|uniref:MmcQ/YjbR family DNA-binding protein n=1 Tax=Mycetocola sp. BIGb0189 TaxID=2940604 RepID=UPI0021688C1D|nr:MmcQ/YjbR family DNA-binding protein [Mycetocola sp. BIGb0189]MCS4277188.1 putative DNA-binding protein (MmcQ/YjbR family) [Mycetocola sp. BIGb0189]
MSALDHAQYAHWDAVACALPGADATYPFGPDARVFRVLGKMFGMISEARSPLWLTLKVDPVRGDLLCRDFPAITPGYHMNKRHWITVVLDESVPPDLIEDLIVEAHERAAAGLTRADRIRLAALGGGR